MEPYEFIKKEIRLDNKHYTVSNLFEFFKSGELLIPDVTSKLMANVVSMVVQDLHLPAIYMFSNPKLEFVWGGHIASSLILFVNGEKCEPFAINSNNDKVQKFEELPKFLQRRILERYLSCFSLYSNDSQTKKQFSDFINIIMSSNN